MDEKDLSNLLRARKVGKRHRSWKCPDEAQLAAYVDSQLAGHARQRVETHLADCDFCLSQVAFLLRLEEAETPGEVPGTLLARARELAGAGAGVTVKPALRWAAVTAATASVALAVTLWLWQPDTSVVPPPPTVAPPAEIPSPPPPVTVAPSVPPRTVRNGQKRIILPELLFPREGSVIAREEVEFRWKEVQRSLFYEIRVVTAEGDLIWEGRIERTQTRLPSDVQLVAGEKYFVWVRAYLPEGKTLKSTIVGFKAGNNG